MKLTGEQLRDLAHDTPVRVLYDSAGNFERGDIIFRKKDRDDCDQSCKFKPNITDSFGFFMTHEEVELIVEEAPPAEACGTIARPILEERKVGKIAIELFDHGFPNAVMAVAEVMTWAAEHKGYKPHDWKNLPNAEVAFDAAASRHRIKRHIQAGSKLCPEFRTDEESDLLHLAHEAFNVLAQLELTLTGKIA